MLQRQGTITHPSTSNDPVLNRDHVIRDIKVKLCFSNIQVQEFQTPRSYHHPAHVGFEQFSFNFDLEKKVLEQAKNSLLSTGGEQSSAQARQHPFLQNGVSTMLIPDRVNTTSETSPTHADNQALTQTVREFEGDNNDPFEMVQLQTIDDMAELQSVLQPNSTAAPTTTSQPTPYPPIATVAVTSHDAPLVDLSDSTTDHSEPPVSTDVVRERPPVAPRHHIPNPAVTSHSSDVIPPIPKPRVRSISPQKEPSPKPISTTGVRVLPPLTSSSSNPTLPQLPSYSSVPAVVTTTASVLPSYEAAISSQQPPKLPPKPQTRTTTATTTAATAAVASPDQYTLPDPTASLSPKDSTTVKQIASMGFPTPRVARAIKHFNDSSKVLDFLVMVGDLEEQHHYNGDSIETALLACDHDVTKAKEYLEKVRSYKEFGFSEQKIHVAYEKANKDWDKTIDILVGDTQ